MSGTDSATHQWPSLTGWRLQGLVRRAQLLAWLLESPTHLELSAAEIGTRCPLYDGVKDTYHVALADLRVIEDYYCWSRAIKAARIAGQSRRSERVRSRNCRSRYRRI